MFRVPRDTVLRRAAATSLLVLTASLSACGGDGEEKAAAPTTAAATPAATTADQPAETTAASTPPQDFKTFSKERAEKITDGVEDQTSIDKLSDKQLSKEAVLKQLRQIEALYKKEGGTPILTIPGETEAVGSYNEDNNKILFFRSEREAGVGTRLWQQLINTNPGFGRADRRGTRTYLLIVPERWKAKHLKQHRAFMERVEKELASSSS